MGEIEREELAFRYVDTMLAVPTSYLIEKLHFTPTEAAVIVAKAAVAQADKFLKRERDGHE